MRRSLLPASMALCTTGLALVLSVAACGSATSPAASGSGSTGPPTGQESVTPTVPASRTPAVLTSTVSGVVSNDAPDGHCRTMVVEGRTLQLVGSLAELTPGSRVTLEGHEDRAMMTACQMGTPFVVDRVIETGT